MPSIVPPRGFVSWIKRPVIAGTNEIPTTRNDFFGLNLGASFRDFIDLDISDDGISCLLRTGSREQLSQLEKLTPKIQNLGMVGFDLLKLRAVINRRQTEPWLGFKLALVCPSGPHAPAARPVSITGKLQLTQWLEKQPRRRHICEFSHLYRL